MKKIFVMGVVLALCVAALAQSAPKADTPAQSNLYLVFLNRPANAPTVSKEQGEKIQEGHMANMRRLHAEGKLMAAGPFLDNDPVRRGIQIFKSDNADDVKAWVASDPAVQAGRLVGEIHPFHPGVGGIHRAEADAPMENFVVILFHWTDEGRKKPGSESQPVFLKHKDYELGLYSSGKTEIGGPFTDRDNDLIGVVIAHGNRQEGEKLAAADPIVAAGIARVELHEWMTAKGVLQH